MAPQQMFQPYAQNKGTLTPGQTIAVNNYTVQVEKYLSQGGFAHVYLVRTPAPVYNTTHHVLKRIAVANESMLTEVKREVDVMRLLKGHPNIVHLIDAAWHKLPNGTFEVFILMEYCPGGGIIDMMNRRLRERLTEAEILQIFVDVCEGVAYMHNSRPPLLHRDLKVENILQSSPTSFKLCDFGSTTTISNPPTNMQEIRFLEADLNRHTTLQYRAPEMVDVYSKRPINEKSDVWALGVLLYKLCYYTTPFEEHGPLAILNVQYRILPYPVYSPEMNMLIASMLREHGAQRPTVFEILVQVHRIRGTKSKFTYAVPVTPPLIPRTSYLTKRNPINPLNGYVAHSIPPPNAALSLYGPGLITNMAVPNQGTQARDKVLDAIAPMRRGRPTHGTETNSLRPSSFEEHHSESTKQDPKTGSLGSAFDAEQDRHWQKTTEKTQTPAKPSNMDDAWTIESVPPTAKAENTQSAGFSDNFTENLSTPEPNKPSFLKSKSSPRPTTNLVTPKDNEMLITPTPLAFTGSRMLRPKQDRVIPNKHKEKDAFEGLGLMSPSIRPAPTLGEARMLRTGLATMSSTPANQGDYLRATTDKLNSSSSSPRPTPSPRPSYFSPIHSQLVSPLSTQDSPGPFLTTQATTSARLPPAGNAESLPIESRFPSVEELDGRFVPSVNSLYPSAVYDGSIRLATQLSSKPADVRSPLFPTKTNYVGTSSSGSNFSRPNIISNVTYSQGVVRSEKITGMGKKDLKEDPVQENNALEARSSTVDRPGASQIPLTPSTPQRRQSLVRKHRSSVSIKLGTLPSLTPEKTQYSSIGIPNSLAPPKIPPRPPSSTPPRDWLTGEEHEEPSMTQTRREAPVLRDSPRKRASFIAQSDFEIPASSAAQHVVPEQSADEPQSIDLSPTVSRFKRAFPEIEKIDVQANTNSLSGLTDNWSPVRRETEPESSSSDEWPEDPGAATSLYAVRERNRVSRNKEQQNSVHELVNQYGGGLLAKEKESKDLPFQTIRTGDYTLRKVQTTGLAPPVKQEGERKTPSPTSNTMTTALAELVTPSKPSHRPQTAISTHQQKPSAAPLATKPPTSTSGRSRPQSMFIFPSKSSDISTPVPLSGTNNLAPPEEPKARAPRRTSISDMVQKYEAISGKVITTLPPGPPSPVRSVSARDPTSLENGRRFFADGVQVTTHQTASAADGSNRLSSSPSKSNAAASDSVHQNIGLGKSPSQPSQKRKTHYRIGSDNWKHVAGMTGNRKLSIKTEPIAITSSNLTDALAAARVARVVNEQDSTYNSQVSRKRTLSIPNPTSSAKADEPRTPVDSERPYQGVGKLIDQWQKKSAEAEQSRPLPPGRRSFTPKRVGTIPD